MIIPCMLVFCSCLGSGDSLVQVSEKDFKNFFTNEDYTVGSSKYSILINDNLTALIEERNDTIKSHIEIKDDIYTYDIYLLNNFCYVKKSDAVSSETFCFAFDLLNYTNYYSDSRATQVADLLKPLAQNLSVKEVWEKELDEAMQTTSIGNTFYKTDSEKNINLKAVLDYSYRDNNQNLHDAKATMNFTYSNKHLSYFSMEKTATQTKGNVVETTTFKYSYQTTSESVLVPSLSYTQIF